MVFENREEAGSLLAKKLESYKGNSDAIVFGIARGGVIVAKVIADKLNLAFDIIVIRKIGAPKNSELAIGAVGPKGTVFWDEDLCNKIGVTENQSSKIKNQKKDEQKEKETLLRDGRKRLIVKGKTVILVDDGVATGATVICALNFLRKEKSKKVILATPVIPKDTFDNISKYFDGVVSLSIEKNFRAVGQFYKEFLQVSDEEVIQIINNIPFAFKNAMGKPLP